MVFVQATFLKNSRRVYIHNSTGELGAGPGLPHRYRHTETAPFQAASFRAGRRHRKFPENRNLIW
jgi:hypothetical protein